MAGVCSTWGFCAPGLEPNTNLSDVSQGWVLSSFRVTEEAHDIKGQDFCAYFVDPELHEKSTDSSSNTCQALIRAEVSPEGKKRMEKRKGVLE